MTKSSFGMPAVKQDAVGVVVVGAELGGAAFSKRLSEKVQGLRMVCLERRLGRSQHVAGLA